VVLAGERNGVQTVESLPYATRVGDSGAGARLDEDNAPRRSMSAGAFRPNGRVP
jgi:hypothetical protein